MLRWDEEYNLYDLVIVISMNSWHFMCCEVGGRPSFSVGFVSDSSKNNRRPTLPLSHRKSITQSLMVDSQTDFHLNWRLSVKMTASFIWLCFFHISEHLRDRSTPCSLFFQLPFSHVVAHDFYVFFLCVSLFYQIHRILNVKWNESISFSFCDHGSVPIAGAPRNPSFSLIFSSI